MVENHLLYAVKIVYRFATLTKMFATLTCYRCYCLRKMFATLTCHRCCHYVGEKCSLRSYHSLDILLTNSKNAKIAQKRPFFGRLRDF
ncbi:hypothetical protein WDU94_007676, partial [Cyamophila willieti]